MTSALDRMWFKTGSGNTAVSRMRNASVYNYRNNSFIVDLAMGQSVFLVLLIIIIIIIVIIIIKASSVSVGELERVQVYHHSTSSDDQGYSEHSERTSTPHEYLFVCTQLGHRL